MLLKINVTTCCSLMLGDPLVITSGVHQNCSRCAESALEVKKSEKENKQAKLTPAQLKKNYTWGFAPFPQRYVFIFNTFIKDKTYLSKYKTFTFILFKILLFEAVCPAAQKRKISRKGSINPDYLIVHTQIHKK